MIDLVIHGGDVVLPDVSLRTDVAVHEGVILGLGDGSTFPPARQVIDARGLFVMAGGIDPHVHIHWPFLDATTPDDFVSATIAAACGGTTTIIDFALQRPGMLPMEAVTQRRAQADGNAVIDYALHCVLTELTPATVESLSELVGAGIPSFKLYMTYSRRGIMANDALMLTVMEKAAELDAIVGVHAENGVVADHLEARLVQAGKCAPRFFPESKPPFVEIEAVGRAIFWAKQAGTRLYVFHLTTSGGAQIIRLARKEGYPIYCETCPQYLLLDDSVFDQEDAFRFICSPPIRRPSDQDTLWMGLSEGGIDNIGSDHCAFTLNQKARGREDFREVPNGLPGVETRFPLLFTHGYVSGRLTLNQLTRVLSMNPARVFGLFPRKGIIAPGSDADLVLVDPEKSVALSHTDLHMDVDWSPYQNVILKGYPVCTISRGQVIVESGQFIGEGGSGRFLPRRLI
jgi:dihydropyrimidinase